MEEYVARLAAHIVTHGGSCPLTSLGKVPKPPGGCRNLKKLLQRRREFVLHDPQQGGGGESASLAGAPNAGGQPTAAPAAAPAAANRRDNGADEYAAQLLECIRSLGGEGFLSNLGGLVRKPAHLRKPLKSYIEARPEVFTLERGAGSSWIVRETAGAEPEPEPDLATQQQVARAFYDHLMADGSLRKRCGKRDSLKAAYQEWRSAQRAQGRVMAGAPPAAILHVLVRELKLVKLSSDLIIFKPAGIYQMFERLREQRDRLEADKFGVAVRPEQVLFDRVVARDGTDERVITVNTSLAEVSLQSVSLMRQDFFSCSFAASGPASLPHALQPAVPTSVRLTFKPSAEGMAGDVLCLSFRSVGGRVFSVCRFVEARCGDADLLDDLKPSAPYSRPKRRCRPREEESGEEMLVPKDSEGPPPDAAAGGGTKLGAHAVNKSWQRLLAEEPKAAATALEQGQQMMSIAPAEEAMRHHLSHFQKLLWTEETQLHTDLSSFDLVEEKSATLSKLGRDLFSLEVRGLAEKRPSVLRGDTVWVTLPGDPRRWQGKAIEIRREDVVLRFHPLFARSYIDNMRVEVRFVLGRRPLRIFHQGLALAKGLPAAKLFPEPEHLLGEPAPSERISSAERARVSREARMVNPDVASNAEQVAAVRAVLLGEKRSVPYILFGPPGTGKTTTVVELVHQYLRGFERARVLVCAPTNAAADVCCEKLGRRSGISERAEMLRLMSYTRNFNEVPEAVRRFTQAYDDALRCYPVVTLREIEAKRLVIATLSMGGSLYNLGVPRGFFDLIVIDESGQAMEPEAIASVASLLSADGQLLLAGDAKQLGPVIHHSHAAAFGLATSYLERLMARAVYARAAGRHDGRVLTKLVRNFRSHEALLELPNKLFYEGELLACAEPMLRNSCLQWEGLPNPRVPMLFHGIEGKDDREGNSPSWYNADEAIQVLRYIESLLRMRQNRILPTEIGVITPYNKQMQKIQRLLKGQDLGEVKVGSTELFQGQERRVIIISTVRSRSDFIGFDAKHKLGFLDNPKRFNVAVTRACSLLIVVGNPAILALDPHWGGLLRKCIEHSAYTGVPPPPQAGGGPDDDDAADGDELLADRLAGMGLDEEEELAEQGSSFEASHGLQQGGSEMPNWGQS